MFSKVLTVLLAVPFLTQSALAANCARTYSVVAGDTCDKISATQKSSTYQLAMANPSINKDCSNLIPGQNLCLGNTGEDCQDVYVVKANDSCQKIYDASGTNSTLLYLNNPQINQACTNIYVGEVVCVSKSGQAAAPPPASAMPAATIPAGAVPANPAPTASKAATTAASTTSASKPTSTSDSNSSFVVANPNDPDYDTLPFCEDLDL
jgi:LysM repeat protein